MFFLFTKNNILFSHFYLQMKLWEFKINTLARELLIDTRKGFNLVFHIVLLSFIQMNLYEPAAIQFYVDFLNRNFTWVNQVPRMVLCTVVRVRFLGLFCLFFVRLCWVDLGRMIKTMCFPLNFSNLHTSWTCVFWKDFSWGTRTKIIIAFQQPPISVSLVVVIGSIQLQ